MRSHRTAATEHATMVKHARAARLTAEHVRLVNQAVEVVETGAAHHRALKTGIVPTGPLARTASKTAHATTATNAELRKTCRSQTKHAYLAKKIGCAASGRNARAVYKRATASTRTDAQA